MKQRVTEKEKSKSKNFDEQTTRQSQSLGNAVGQPDNQSISRCICTTLRCTAVCCAVLYCTITALYYTELNCTVLLSAGLISFHLIAVQRCDFDLGLFFAFKCSYGHGWNVLLSLFLLRFLFLTLFYYQAVTSCTCCTCRKRSSANPKTTKKNQEGAERSKDRREDQRHNNPNQNRQIDKIEKRKKKSKKEEGGGETYRTIYK